MLRSLLIVAAACSLSLGSGRAVAQDLPRLRVQGRWLVDAQGAVVLLRGLNVGIDGKVPPFRPLADLSALDALPSLGVNVARLPVSWEAFEPERGQYDASYFEYVAKVVDGFRARGIWVVIDLHQDAFSRFSNGGCGDGFPRWALPADVAPREPDNSEACAAWGVSMIVDPAMHRSWSAFYANEAGVRDRYLRLLERLAEQFGEDPTVVGFDLMNEPWGDEVTEIAPLYRDAARVIRARAPDSVLFLAPHALVSSGLPSLLPRLALDNVVYSPHFYDGGVLLLGAWGGGDLSGVFDVMQQTAEQLGTPWFLSEMGAPANSVRALDYVDALYAQLDARLVSAAQWGLAPSWNPLTKDGWNGEDLSIMDDRGALRPNYRVRPYLARVSGIPTSFGVRYAPGDSVDQVVVAWDNVPGRGDTRVFVASQAAFGGRVRVEHTEGAARCGLDAAGLTLSCVSEQTGPHALTLSRCGAFRDGCLVAGATPPEPAVDLRPTLDEGCRLGGEGAPAFSGPLGLVMLGLWLRRSQRTPQMAPPRSEIH